jgi:hypothetical protein
VASSLDECLLSWGLNPALKVCVHGIQLESFTNAFFQLTQYHVRWHESHMNIGHEILQPEATSNLNGEKCLNVPRNPVGINHRPHR